MFPALVGNCIVLVFVQKVRRSAKADCRRRCNECQLDLYSFAMVIVKCGGALLYTVFRWSEKDREIGVVLLI